MRRFTAVLVAAIAIAVSAPSPASAREGAPVAYLPPVEAPLTDLFRPPASQYGPGNRGVDYGTTDQQPVAAAADGEVTFSGRVGHGLHVVVLHADGIRTSYSFLASADVARGERVEQGQRIGLAGATGLHFGARAGDEYLDPLSLLGRRRTQVHLVADDERRPLAEVVERRRLIESLHGVRRAVGNGVDWIQGRAVATYDRYVDLAEMIADGLIDLAIPIPVHLAVAAARWEAAQDTCTSAATSVPTAAAIHGGGERIAIMVGGLGSSTGGADVLSVDTAALGYDEANVHQFSYRSDGGPYGPADTLVDIDASGALLASVLADWQRRRPGARIDVLAHSLGGLVARSAVTRHGAMPATLVTMASPHQGTELASAAAGFNGSTTGRFLLDASGVARPFGGDLNAPAILQMSESSDFLDDLRRNGRWPPTGRTHVATIGARDDVIVPGHHTRLEGIAGTVLTPSGTEGTFDDHGGLPGAPETAVEIARALAGQHPTCETLADVLLDEMSSRRTANVQDRVGLALTVAGVYADLRIAAPLHAAAIGDAGKVLGR